MSWTKKNVHPGKIISTSQEVEVQVLEVDAAKRRISLGLKQTLQNPWEAFAEKHPVGSTVEGEVKNKTEFGLFIGLDGDVDGMVHLSDLDWTRPGEQAIEDYKKGDKVRAKVLDVDIEKERIALGVKQLASDPFAAKKAGEEGGEGELRKGSVVTCEVIEVKDGGIEVKIAGTDLDRLHQAQRTGPRPRRPAPRALLGRREGRRAHHPVRPPRPQDRRLHQGAGSRRGEGSDRPIRLGRLGRFARRHSRRRAEGARPEEVSPRSFGVKNRPARSDPRGLFYARRKVVRRERFQRLGRQPVRPSSPCALSRKSKPEVAMTWRRRVSPPFHPTKRAMFIGARAISTSWAPIVADFRRLRREGRLGLGESERPVSIAPSQTCNVDKRASDFKVLCARLCNFRRLLWEGLLRALGEGASGLHGAGQGQTPVEAVIVVARDEELQIWPGRRVVAPLDHRAWTRGDAGIGERLRQAGDLQAHVAVKRLERPVGERRVDIAPDSGEADPDRGRDLMVRIAAGNKVETGLPTQVQFRPARLGRAARLGALREG